MKTVWIAEVDGYWKSPSEWRKLQVEADTEEKVRASVQSYMDEFGLVVGETCYAPTIREHIRITE